MADLPYPPTDTQQLAPGYPPQPGYPPGFIDISAAAYPPQSVPHYPPIDFSTAAYPPAPPTKAWDPLSMSSDDEVVIALTKSFEQSLKGRDGLNGIAIVLAVVDSSAPAGTTVDINNVKSTFEKLNFGVWVVRDPTAKQLAAVVHIATTHHYMYSTWCHCIMFYFAGHGGSFNGKEYIIPVREDGDPNPMYYIDEGIVYPFQPNNAPLLGSRFRIFFFDCCLTQTKSTAKQPVSSKPLHSKPPSSLPPRGQCLIAYATSLHYVSSGSYSTGGIWTKHLCNNINEYADNLPLTTILDITYDDVVNETNLEGKTLDSEIVVQGPHYNSSIGLFYLKAPFKRSKDQFKEAMLTLTSDIPMQQNEMIDDQNDADIDIESILNCVPESIDLKNALKDMKDNADLWQNQFGKRMIESETSLKNCLTLEFLIDYIYSMQCQPTWGDVIKALEDPWNIEVVVNRNEKIIVADSVRKYLCNKAVFLKYKSKRK